MTTRILDLAQISGELTAVNNAWWVYAIKFVVSDQDSTPIPLTGIEFKADLRSPISSVGVPLEMSTANGLLVKDDVNGLLTISVPRSAAVGSFCMERVPPTVGDPYQMDIVASDGTYEINLCQDGGPIAVTVKDGVTRS